MLFIKLAIILQIQQIFRGAHKSSVHWLSIVLITIITTGYTANAIAEIAECVPREKIWNLFASGVCINNNSLVVASGALNIGIDFLIFLLPIYAILRLKIVLKRKLGILGVFATGLL